MTIRICSAALILALSYSGLGAAPATGSLATLARAYRESPSPARRSALAAYIAAHPEGRGARQSGAGDHGVRTEELHRGHRRAQAAAGKAGAHRRLFRLLPGRGARGIQRFRSDIGGPGRGASQFAAQRQELAAGSAGAQSVGAADAVRLLRDHYAELPQPEGDVTLADCYQAANDLPHAAEFYQRVYYHYLTGAAASRAAVALLTLKDAMGADYPPPGAAQMLHRADRLVEANEYAQARKEYEGVAAQAGGVERDQAMVRIGAADYLAGKTAPPGLI